METYGKNFSRLATVLPIRYPIIQAPMAGGPSSPELVGSVSNAGALGSIGAGYLTAPQLSESIRKARKITDNPIAVNLMVPPKTLPQKSLGANAQSELLAIAKELELSEPLDFNPEIDCTKFKNQIDVVIQSKVDVVSFVFGLPSQSQVDLLKKADIVLAGTATSVEEALAIEELGLDFVIFQGHEAGGHRGGFLWEGTIGLLSLLESARGKVTIPYVAAGGIISGAGIAATLVLGAAAAQMGSAFLVTQESGASTGWKQNVAQARSTDTVITKSFSGKQARGIKNEFIERMEVHTDELASYPITNSITGAIRRKAKETADNRFQSLWSGQSPPKYVNGISAQELIDQLVKQLQECRAV